MKLVPTLGRITLKQALILAFILFFFSFLISIRKTEPSGIFDKFYDVGYEFEAKRTMSQFIDECKHISSFYNYFGVKKICPCVPENLGNFRIILINIQCF